MARLIIEREIPAASSLGGDERSTIAAESRGRAHTVALRPAAMTAHRLIVAVAMLAVLLVGAAPAVLAGGSATDQQRKEAAGWGCGAAIGLPAGHCINPANTNRLLTTGTLPKTFQLQVFDAEGTFLTAEIATFMASADNRACPHDPDSPDGTYWAFVPGVLYVCHHRAG